MNYGSYDPVEERARAYREYMSRSYSEWCRKRDEEERRTNAVSGDAADLLRFDVNAVDDYGILGCTPMAANEELVVAYRLTAKHLHPDCLKANGYPDSMLQRATEAMSRLNAAWSRIRKSRRI